MPIRYLRNPDVIPNQAENGGKFLSTDSKNLTWSTQLYDLALTVNGKPDAGVTVLTFAAVRAFTIPASFVGSLARARIAASNAAASFAVNKNGLTIGTVTFATNSSVGTFSGSGAEFAVGDILTITAPGTVDSTLADISLVIVTSLI